MDNTKNEIRNINIKIKKCFKDQSIIDKDNYFINQKRDDNKRFYDICFINILTYYFKR